MSGYDAYDDRPAGRPQVALIDLLDRLLSGGVVLTGDLVLSIADIDLLRISLRAVIVSVREQLDDQWATFIPPASSRLRSSGGYPHGRAALTEHGGQGDEPG